MPVVVVCVFAVSAQPAQAGVGSAIVNFFSSIFSGGSSSDSTQQNVYAQPRSMSSGGADGAPADILVAPRVIEQGEGRVRFQYDIHSDFEGSFCYALLFPPSVALGAFNGDNGGNWTWRDRAHNINRYFFFPEELSEVGTYHIGISCNKGGSIVNHFETIEVKPYEPTTSTKFHFSTLETTIGSSKNQSDPISINWDLESREYGAQWCYLEMTGTDGYIDLGDSAIYNNSKIKQSGEGAVSGKPKGSASVFLREAGDATVNIKCESGSGGGRKKVVFEQSVNISAAAGSSAGGSNTGTSDGGGTSSTGASGSAAAGSEESSDTEGGSTGGSAGSDTDASVTSNFTVTPETIEQGEGLVAMTFDVKDEYRPEHGGKTCYVYHALPGVTIGGSENWWDWREKGVFSHTYYFYTDELEQLGKHTFVVSCSKDGKIYNEFRYVTVKPFNPTQSSLFKVDDDTIESGDNVRVIGITWNVPRSKFCKLSSTGGDLKNTPEEISAGLLRKAFPNSGNAELHVSEKMESGDATVSLICSDPGKGRRSHTAFAQTITLKHVDGTGASDGGDASDTGASGSAAAGGGESSDTEGGSTDGPKRGTDFIFNVTKGAPVGDGKVNVTVSLEVKTAGVSCTISAKDGNGKSTAITEGMVSGNFTITQPIILPATYTAICAKDGKTTAVQETVKEEGAAGGNSDGGGSGASGTTSDDSGDGNVMNGATTLTATPATVKPNEPFTLTWSSQQDYCEPIDGPWSISSIMKQSHDSVQRLWVIFVKRTKLKSQGSFVVEEGITEKTVFTLACSNVDKRTTWPFGKQEVSVMVDVVTPVDEDATSNTSTNSESGTLLRSDKESVVPGEPFTLTWSSDKKYCRPVAGPWSIEDVKKKKSELVRENAILGVTLNAVSHLVPRGVFQHDGITTNTEFAIKCYDNVGEQWWGYDYASVTVKVINGGSGSSSGDSGSPQLITDFTVTPGALPGPGGQLTVSMKFGDDARTCTWYSQVTAGGAKPTDSNWNKEGRYTGTGDNAPANESSTFDTDDIANGSTLHLRLTCKDASGREENRVLTVPIGATAGIENFVATPPHLEKPGHVTLSWQSFGMENCAVKAKTVDGEDLFTASLRRSETRTTAGNRYYDINKPTRFTLTCTPLDGGVSVTKQLLVSVGDYVADQAVPGTEGAAYARYCPFDVSEGSPDRVVRFSKRLEYAGDEDVIDGVNVPAGKYAVWLSSSDTFDDRGGWQNQQNERYYVRLLDANGTEVATTAPTDDLRDDTDAHGKVTQVATELVVSKPVAKVIAVHAEGDDGSLNPGCAYFKRLDVTTDTNDAPADSGTRSITPSSRVGLLGAKCDTRIGSVAATFANGSQKINTYCDGQSVNVKVNNGADAFTWKKAYYTTDGNTLNRSVTLRGTTDATGQWIVGPAEAVLNDVPLGQTNYIAVYSCKKDTDGQWRCGCKENGECSEPASGKFIWDLEAFIPTGATVR